MKSENMLRVSIQLVINLIKHAATIGMGDDARQVIAETWLDFFDNETIEQFNQWLEKPKTLKKISRAIDQAEACFRNDSSKAHPDLKDAIHRYRGLSLTNLPGFLEKIESWTEAPEATDWEVVILSIFKKDFDHHFSENDLRVAAKQYVYCLRKHLAMLGDDTFTPKLVADGIARNQEILIGLEERLAEVQSTVQANFDMLTIGHERQHVLRPFTTHYLGTTDGKKLPRPFGGRNEEIKELNTWLFDQDQHPYGLLVANAGMGKSALLLNWLKALRIDPRFESYELVYYPISARFRTNLESEVLSTIAAQLGGLHGESISAAKEGMDYRGLIYRYLHDVPFPEEKQRLIVVDGLDESATLKLPELLFPFAPPEKSHILMAARTMPDGRQWDERLGWEKEWHQTFTLNGLSQDGITDVLFRMGNPLAQLGDEEEIIKELHHLSEEGDPFLVELYIQELLNDANQLTGFKVDNLFKLKPGLRGFFDKWIDDQIELWGDGDPFEKPHIQAFKNFCAFAKGPLREYDFLQLEPQAFSNQARMIKQAVKTFERFIISTDEGYVFTHPRLAQYFTEEEKHQAQTIQKRFVSYGKKILEGLNNEELDPLQARDDFTYIVQHYADHLDESKALTEEYYALISGGWLRAWEALEGTHKGFLSDVNKAWEKAKGSGADALHIQILAGLCHSSVVSRSGNIGGRLLLALWKNNNVSNLQLRNRIDQITNQAIRLETMLECSEAIKTFPTHVFERYKEETRGFIFQRPLKDVVRKFASYSDFLTKNEQETFLSKALKIVRQTNDEKWKAELLNDLFPHISKNQLREVLIVVREISSENDRAKLLSPLTSYLDKGQLIEVLTDARQISDEKSRARLLYDIAHNLDEEKTELLSEAFATAKEINDSSDRAVLLSEFVPYFGKEQPHIISDALEFLILALPLLGVSDIFRKLVPYLSSENLSELLEVAKESSDEGHRAELLCILIPHLEEEQQPTALNEALVAARKMSNEYLRARVLCDLALFFDEEKTAVLSESLTAAQQISKESERARVIGDLIPRLEAEHLIDVAIMASQMSDKEARTKLVSTLVPYLRKEQLSEALAVSSKIRDESDIAKFLRDIAFDLKEAQASALAKALVASLQISNESDRAKITGSLASRLSKNQLIRALGAAREIRESRIRAIFLRDVAHHFSEDNGTVLDEALDAAIEISNESDRVKIIGEFAPLLGKEYLGKVFVAAKQISNESDRVDLFSDLAPYLDSELLSKVFAEAKHVSGELRKASLLCALTPHLNTGQLSKTLRMAKDINDGYCRAKLLRCLIPHLEKERLSEILDAAKQINGVGHRIGVLCNLLPYIEDDKGTILDEALALARQISSPFDRFDALGILVPYLNADQLSEAMGMSGGSDFSRYSFLSRLIPYLDENQLGEALIAAKQIGEERDRVKLFGQLASRLDKDQLSDVLVSAKQISEELWKLVLLKDIAPYLDKEQLSKALSIVRETRDEMRRVWLLIFFAPYLAEEKAAILNEAFAESRQIRDEKVRARIFSFLVPHIHKELLSNVLDEIRTYLDIGQTVVILEKLFERWEKWKASEIKTDEELLKEIITLYASTERKVFLHVIRIITPKLRDVGGEELVLAVADEAQQVVSWWP